MKKRYRVVLTTWDREDIGDGWKTAQKTLFVCDRRWKGFQWMDNHSYLNTEIDNDDNLDCWLHYQEMKLVRY